MQVLDNWLLTPARAAVHLPTRTVVVADLHLGYDRVRRRGGEALPARRLATELAPLRDLLSRQGLRRLIVAGDLFEDGRYQREEMVEELLSWVADMNVDLIAVVPGNHDRGLDGTRLPIAAEGIEVGGWRIVHGDRVRVEGPIVQGHEHPYLRCRGGAEGPCYLVAPGHLVLPAYSADAAGGNVLGQGRWSAYRCCVIAGDRVLDFGVLGELTQRLRSLVAPREGST